LANAAREALADTDPIVLRDCVLAKLHRLERFRLSPNEKYEFEEIVLWLTLRVEISVMSRLLLDVFPKMAPQIQLAEWDSAFCRAVTASGNASTYAAAVTALRKNWFSDFPIDLISIGVAHLFECANR